MTTANTTAPTAAAADARQFLHRAGEISECVGTAVQLMRASDRLLRDALNGPPEVGDAVGPILEVVTKALGELDGVEDAIGDLGMNADDAVEATGKAVRS